MWKYSTRQIGLLEKLDRTLPNLWAKKRNYKMTEEDKVVRYENLKCSTRIQFKNSQGHGPLPRSCCVWRDEVVQWRGVFQAPTRD